MTIPEVFIIESLTLKDERLGAREGEILARMLAMSGKKQTQYFYIRTAQELDEIIDVFDKSDCRYLHISCHADSNAMATTFDTIRYSELGRMLAPCIKNRRVFVSACEMANPKLASALLKDTGCTSLMGPAENINFDDAAAFWVAFYHLMFKHNDRAMKHAEIERYGGQLSRLFCEPINYFRRDTNKACGFTHISHDEFDKVEPAAA